MLTKSVFFGSFSAAGVFAFALGCGRLPTPVALARPEVARAPLAPSLAPLTGSIRALVSTDGFVCALRSDGALRCVEDPTADDGLVTAPMIYTLSASTLELTATVDSACARDTDGTLRCVGSVNAWGSGAAGALSLAMGHREVPGVRATGGVALGDRHACAWTRDGVASCWGANDFGQLGAAPSSGPQSPLAVRGLDGVTAMATGWAHTCAVLRDGAVRCWGENSAGQLGDGGDTAHDEPVPVAGLPLARALAAGRAHTCALLADANVRCWGANSAGQLGDDTRDMREVPVSVVGVSGVVQLVACEETTCALSENGTVRCWGRGNFARGSAPRCEQWQSAPCHKLASPVEALRGARRISLSAARSGGFTRVCGLFDGDVVRCTGASAEAHTLSWEAPPPPCMTAQQRAARALQVAELVDHDTLVYCLGVRSDDLRPRSAACWRADLARGQVVATTFPQERSEYAPRREHAFEATREGNVVRVCHAGTETGCRTVPVSAAPAGDDGPPPRHAITDDGAVLITSTAPAVFESWSVANATRIARFEVVSPNYERAVGGLYTVGPTLVVEHCAAGPACEGRFVNLRNGRVIGPVAVNLYNAGVFHVGGDVWAFTDGYGDAIAWHDTRTGRRTRPLLRLPGSGPESQTQALRRNEREVLMVYGGEDSLPESGVSVGGDVVGIDLVTGRVLQRLSVPTCP